eukprot:3086079-Rhodomonas_salina.1
MQPNKMRWGVATQEIVFPKVCPPSSAAMRLAMRRTDRVPWINAFMGAGNVTFPSLSPALSPFLPLCLSGWLPLFLPLD